MSDKYTTPAADASSAAIRAMRWEAPMTWQAPGDAILRLLDVPGASRAESVFAVLTADGVGVRFVAGDSGKPIRSGLLLECTRFIGSVADFHNAAKFAAPYSKPRSPIAGMVGAAPASPVPAGDMMGAFVAALSASVGPIVDAKVAEATEGVDARIDECVRRVVQSPVIVRVERGPDVKVDAGDHSQFAPMVAALMAQANKDRNVLLYGERGSGKTTAAMRLADKIGVPCAIVPMAGATEGTFVGRYLPTEGGAFALRRTTFVDVWERGGVVCVDELDKADPTVAVVLNAALANGVLTLADGSSVQRHASTLVLGAANALSFSKAYTAAQPQDGSLLDRFLPWEWNVCGSLLGSMVCTVAGSDKGKRILRIRDKVNGHLREKRFTDWDVGTRSAMRMAHAAAAGVDYLGLLGMEAKAFAPTHVDDVKRLASAA